MSLSPSFSTLHMIFTFVNPISSSGIDSRHPWRSGLRPALRASKTAILPFCRTLDSLGFETLLSEQRCICSTSIYIFVRRGRDSNPRWSFWTPYSLSRGAPSASRPPLQFSSLLFVTFVCLVNFNFAFFANSCRDRRGFFFFRSRFSRCCWCS